jgi:hypothetical protein
MNGTHIVDKARDMTLEVCAAQHKIHQVMINLLNNAVKYAPNLKIITIAVERSAEFIKVSVTLLIVLSIIRFFEALKDIGYKFLSKSNTSIRYLTGNIVHNITTALFC